MGEPEEPLPLGTAPIEAINNLETARMALRWSLERIRALEKELSELPAKAEKAAGAKAEAAYAQKLASLEKERVLKSAEISEKEEWMARRERALEDRERSFNEFSGRERDRLERESKSLNREIEEQVRFRLGNAERLLEERHASLEAVWGREKEVLNKALDDWRRTAQENIVRIRELEQGLADTQRSIPRAWESATRGSDRRESESRERELLELTETQRLRIRELESSLAAERQAAAQAPGELADQAQRLIFTIEEEGASRLRELKEDLDRARRAAAEGAEGLRRMARQLREEQERSAALENRCRDADARLAEDSSRMQAAEGRAAELRRELDGLKARWEAESASLRGELWRRETASASDARIAELEDSLASAREATRLAWEAASNQAQLRREAASPLRAPGRRRPTKGKGGPKDASPAPSALPPSSLPPAPSPGSGLAPRPYAASLSRCCSALQTYGCGIRVIKTVLARLERETASEAGSVVPSAAADGGLRRFMEEVLNTLDAGDQELLALTRMSTAGNYLHAHSVNVAILSLAVAHQLRWTGEALEVLGLGALLADIGLSRRAARPPEEAAAGKPEDERSHPLESARLLERIPDLAAATRGAVARVIADTHERKDGSGYPRGAASRDGLQPASLVIGLCDLYEDLSHPRAWRPALPAAEAIKVILTQHSRGFDPLMVRALIETLSMYPPGSYVTLSGGEIGRVVRIDRNAVTLPTVEVVLDAEGRRKEPPQVIDLAGEPLLRVTRPIDETQVDVRDKGLLARFQADLWWRD